MVYSEGILVGYRYYDTKKMPVQYPFGHGLSYTSFAYSDLAVDMESNTITVKVCNTGKIPGAEIVQVYVHDLESYMFRPQKELKGFTKVYLMPNEEKTVTIDLDKRAFAYYVPHLGRFAVEAGEFDILVGSSSRDIHLEKRIVVDTGEVVRQLPGMDDTLNDWLEDFRTRDKALGLLRVMDMDEYSTHYGIMIGMPMDKVLWFFKEQGASVEDVERMSASLVL